MTPKAQAPRAEQPASDSKTPENRGALAARPKPISESRLSDQPNPAAEFIGGVGEGLYNVAEGTVTGAYSALTTNPVTTVRNVGRGIAGMIDTPGARPGQAPTLMRTMPDGSRRPVKFDGIDRRRKT